VLLVLPLGAAAAFAQDGSDPWPTEGWATSTPEAQGMDSALLAEGLEYLLEQDGLNIHSLTIIRNGNIVTDAYFHPFQEGWLHDLASATKSFTSTLVGIAIDEGLIEGVEQPVLTSFPDRSAANIDADKEAMTVEDLLTMSSGFACEPVVVDPQVFASPDWVQSTIDLPMAAAPGIRWNYCNQNVHLLSALIGQVSGMNALEFAQARLFEPLGISEAAWPTDPQGNNRGSYELLLAPRDMAKLGYLYLHEGEWDGQQVLPADWVAAATTPAVASNYGYLWWLDRFRSSYYADGSGGQRIFVFPDQELVVVTTGGEGTDVYGVLAKLLGSYVLPAVRVDVPLPDDPDGQAALRSRVQEAAAPPPAEPKPVPRLPETAKMVSDQTYIFDANPAGLRSVSMTFDESAEAQVRLTYVDGNQLEWVIGLDNVPRLSPGLYGLPAAARGEWESDDVFVLDFDEIGNIDKERHRVAFEEDRIIVDGALVGRLDE
jgi:CubicO group peptidase (beta-lactamase class C family)